jgi:serine/threonine-protein kinase
VTPQRIGRYVLLREVAAGGMASVVLGRMRGPAGFGKTVAVKRLHPQFAKDPEFVSMFLDEARVTSGLSHTNIVLTLDVLEEPGELLLVMEYVHGAALSTVLRTLKERKELIPPPIAGAIMAGALHGLHAAHQATDEVGTRLDIVHRDVSPQNILVSTDGIAKIADFGIAKAVGQVHSTSEGVMKGKFAYMAPEQARSEPVSPKTDIYSAGIVLWELLTTERAVSGATNAERLLRVLELEAPLPSTMVPDLPPAFDAIVARALARNPDDRYPSARAMAMALETETALASTSEVGAWLQQVAAEPLKVREEILSEMRRQSVRHAFPSSPDLGDSSGSLAAAAARDALDASEATTSSPVSLDDLTEGSLSSSAVGPAPPSRRRGLLIAGFVLSLLVLGAGLALALGARAPAPTVATSSSSPPPPSAPSMPPAVATADVPPSVELAAPSASPSSKAALVAATTTPTAKPATPTGASTAKPGAAAAPSVAAKGKCKIEVVVDGAGRTNFKEVCAP